MKTRVGKYKKGEGAGDGVFAGRPSLLSNPHEIGWCPACGQCHDRASAIAAYQGHFDMMIQLPAFRSLVLSVDGKLLLCWCREEHQTKPPCHCDIIVAWLEKNI